MSKMTQRSLERSSSSFSKSWQIVDGVSNPSSSSRSSSRPGFSSSSCCSSASSKDSSEAVSLPMIESPRSDSKDAIRVDGVLRDSAQVHLDATLEQQQISSLARDGSFSHLRPRSSNAKDQLVTVLDSLIGEVELQQVLLNNMIENNVKESQILSRSSLLHVKDQDALADHPSCRRSLDEEDPAVLQDLRNRVTELESMHRRWIKAQESKSLVWRKGFLVLIQSLAWAVCVFMVVSRLRGSGMIPT